MLSPKSRRASILTVFLFIVTVLSASSEEAQLPKEVLQSLPASTTIAAPLPAGLERPTTAIGASAFAWLQFLALNSKADLNAPRGTPLPELGGSGDTLVWQTWAHKVELRPNAPLTTPWDELGPPNYANHAYQIPIFEGETDSELPASWTLWNNLDEDNEIGSCNVNTPRQTQNPLDRDLVLYQVKVNKDEYEYLRTNYGADQNDANGKLGQAQNMVAAYLKNPFGNPNHAYYRGAPSGPQATCDCPPEKAICLPCGGYPPTSATYPDGAIETKSAWRRLHPGEDSSRFYTTQAIYYTYDEVAKSYKYNNGTFALIGLHIIRKLANYPDFVFTTFEHESVEDGYEYYTIDGNGAVSGNVTPARRQTGNNYGTQQNHKVLPGVEVVNRGFRTSLANLNSIWQHYRLTGIQTQSLDCNPVNVGAPGNCRAAQNTAECVNLDLEQNYYMANLVIETDPFLNNFSGPGFGGDPFGDCRNTVYNGRTYNNGGCKGCHGVAQTAFGTDFSFLLDFGEGKPALKPDTIHYRHPVGDFQGPLLNILIGARPASLVKAAGFDHCASLCGSSANCTAWTFFPATQDCSIHDGTPGNYFYHPIGATYLRDGFPITGLPAPPPANAAAPTLADAAGNATCLGCHVASER